MAWLLNLEGGIATKLVAIEASTTVFPGDSHEQVSLPYTQYQVAYRRDSDLQTGGPWIATIEVFGWHTSSDSALELGYDIIAALEQKNAPIGGVNVRHVTAMQVYQVQQEKSPGVIENGIYVQFEALIDA